MQYIAIEGLSRNISRIALGSTYFGTTVTESTAFDLLDLYCSLGGTVIDTARVYGQDFPGGPGRAEEVLGTWLAKTGMRSSLVVASKGLHHDLAMHSRFNLQNLQTDLEQSLEALRTDHLDIWFFHRDDPTMPVDEAMDMLDEVASPKLVGVAGASNWSAKRIEAANAYARTHGKRTLGVSEIQWSLARSTPESWNDPTLVCMDGNELAWYAKTGIPVFAYSAQAKGLFSKALAAGLDSLGSKARSRFLSPTNQERIHRVGKLSDTYSIPPAAIATSYICSHSIPSIAIIGCSTTEQLKESMQGGTIDLNEGDREFLLDKEAW